MGGAVAVAAFASDRPPAADRLVLLAPAVWGWSSQAAQLPRQPVGSRTSDGSTALEPPDWAVRDIRASDNLVELLRMGRDPDMIFATRFDALCGLVDLMETASRDLGRTRVPTALFYGAHDQIIEDEPMALALERAGEPPNLRTAYYRRRLAPAEPGPAGPARLWGRGGLPARSRRAVPVGRPAGSRRIVSASKPSCLPGKSRRRICRAQKSAQGRLSSGHDAFRFAVFRRTTKACTPSLTRKPASGPLSRCTPPRGARRWAAAACGTTAPRPRRWRTFCVCRAA